MKEVQNEKHGLQKKQCPVFVMRVTAGCPTLARKIFGVIQMDNGRTMFEKNHEKENWTFPCKK